LASKSRSWPGRLNELRSHVLALPDQPCCHAEFIDLWKRGGPPV
jgi:hypothetical protein